MGDEDYVLVVTLSPSLCIDPPFIKGAKSSETPVGRPGVLHCDTAAVPKPEFEWYRDDKRYNLCLYLHLLHLMQRT